MIFTTPAFGESISIILPEKQAKIHNALEFTADGLKITSVTADLDFISLIFDVTVTEAKGDLTIQFDRHIFDAKNGDDDDEFFVLADGEEIQFEEEKLESMRILSFSLPQGTEEFEVIGTILLGESFLVQLEEAAKRTIEEKAAADKEIAEQAALIERANQLMEQALAEHLAEEAAQAAQLAEESKLAALEDACGEGTIFENGECVAPVEESIDSGPLINSIFAAMGIGLAVMIILWGIGRSRHKKLSGGKSDEV